MLRRAHRATVPTAPEIGERIFIPPEPAPSYFNPPSREEKFVAALDKSIAFHRSNPNDPHGVGNAVIASLSEVRSAFVAAFGLKG